MRIPSNGYARLGFGFVGLFVTSLLLAAASSPIPSSAPVLLRWSHQDVVCDSGGGAPSPTGSLITGGETERRQLPTSVVNDAPMSGRWFGPGARSQWHCHTSGQFLLVMEGRGRVQKRGERMRELTVGESEYAGPLIEHWHGAAPDASVQYLGINYRPGGDIWMEEVSQEDYLGNGIGLTTRMPR